MAHDPLNLESTKAAQRSMFKAMRTQNAMQTALDHAVALNKSRNSEPAARTKTIDTLALLAGARQPNSAGEQVVAEFVHGLLDSFTRRTSNSASDPVLVPGTPPLTRSMVEQGVIFFANSLGVKLRSSETTILEALFIEVWKRGVTEEIAAVVALVEHARSGDPAAPDPGAGLAIIGQFLEPSWSEPFLLWTHAVWLRAQYIGESIDPELQKANNESEKLRKENERLTAALKELKEKESITSKQLDSTRSELKFAVAQQGNLQRKLDQISTGEEAPNGESLEHRIRIILVRYPGPGLFIDPHIPPKKVVNARLECKVPADERLLALLDLTVFGSAKDAVVIGANGIYYHSSGNRCTVLYSELDTLQIQRVDSHVLKFCSQTASEPERGMSTLGSSYPAEKLKAVLDDIKPVYAEGRRT